MPRPLVHPANRSRAARACVICKASKKRCDARLPCLLCVKKGRAESCRYPESSQRVDHSPPPTPVPTGDAPAPVPAWPLPLPSTTHPSRREQPRASVTPMARQQRQQLPRAFMEGSNTPHGAMSEAVTRDSSPQRGQRPTMLRNSRGEQVYIGNTAAISFLHFLQKTLKRYIGPSSFTDRQRGETMLEAEVHDDGTNSFEDDLDLVEKQDLIQCFMRVSNGILHLFSKEEISRLLGINNSQPSTNEGSNLQTQHDDFACLYLLVAIGAQSRGSNQTEIQRARKYFAKAQQMAFIDMLQDPSLGMVKIFLLMAMYMLGACRRNTAFMYIGIASKAATILGLHVPYQHVRASSEERTERRQTWMSLRVLDLICSSILARPSSTPSIERDEYEIDRPSSRDIDHRTLALNANYESSAIIESIVQKFSRSSVVDIESASTYLQMLREWSQALPDSLRTSPKSADGNLLPDLDHRETTVGNIHVACTYYFGVIIVTRQFLISRIMSQLRGGKASRAVKGIEAVPMITKEKDKLIELSNACISSAVYMVELCYQASISNILLDNMCILKAWLFSAGLVLGFSLLMEDRDLADIREAFSHAREVLGKLARLSPQAEQYHDILTNFSAAIILYREQLSVEQNQSSNLYVEKIMTIEMAHDVNNGDLLYDGDNDQLQAQVPAMLRTPDQSDGFDGFDDAGGIFSSDLFSSQLELPPFSAQIGNDIGLSADLEWLCYAAS